MTVTLAGATYRVVTLDNRVTVIVRRGRFWRLANSDLAAKIVRGFTLRCVGGTG